MTLGGYVWCRERTEKGQRHMPREMERHGERENCTEVRRHRGRDPGQRGERVPERTRERRRGGLPIAGATGLQGGETDPHRGCCFFLWSRAPVAQLWAPAQPPDSREARSRSPVASSGVPRPSVCSVSQAVRLPRRAAAALLALLVGRGPSLGSCSEGCGGGMGGAHLRKAPGPSTALSEQTPSPGSEREQMCFYGLHGDPSTWQPRWALGLGFEAFVFPEALSEREH